MEEKYETTQRNLKTYSRTNVDKQKTRVRARQEDNKRLTKVKISCNKSVAEQLFFAQPCSIRWFQNVIRRDPLKHIAIRIGSSTLPHHPVLNTFLKLFKLYFLTWLRMTFSWTRRRTKECQVSVQSKCEYTSIKYNLTLKCLCN